MKQTNRLNTTRKKEGTEEKNDKERLKTSNDKKRRIKE
jgi:hypothetical protein